MQALRNIRRSHWFSAFLALLIVGGSVVYAQQDVIFNGTDSAGNVVRLRVDSTGNVGTYAAPSSSAAHGACTHTATTVGTTATNVPSSARSDRSSLTICMSTAATVACEFDGNAAVQATGLELGDGDCIVVGLAGSVAASCICDTAGCDVRVAECP